MKLKDKIEELGLDYKKEILKLLGLFVVIIGFDVFMYFYTQSLFAIAGGVLVMFVVGYVYLSRYQGMIDKLLIARRKELINLITFFEIYIHNGVNVYQSLSNISNFASPFLKEKIDELLKEIDVDKSVTPFINFAKQFNSLIIEQLFISIYQLIDEGNHSTSLNQFQALFSKMNDEEHTQNLEDRCKKLDRANITPVIGAAMITIVISIGIVSIIGGSFIG